MDASHDVELNASMVSEVSTPVAVTQCLARKLILKSVPHYMICREGADMLHYCTYVPSPYRAASRYDDCKRTPHAGQIVTPMITSSTTVIFGLSLSSPEHGFLGYVLEVVGYRSGCDVVLLVLSLQRERRPGSCFRLPRPRQVLSPVVNLVLWFRLLFFCVHRLLRRRLSA